MREAIVNCQRGTRKPNNQKTTPTQVFCIGVSLSILVVKEDSEFSLTKSIAYAINNIFLGVKLDFYFKTFLLYY